MNKSVSSSAARLQPILSGLGLAAVSPLLVPRTLPVLPIVVSCDDCADIPWWAQVILTLIGVGIAMVILWIPRRLSRRIDNPRWRAIVRWGGVAILLVGLVALARLAVLVLPDD